MAGVAEEQDWRFCGRAVTVQPGARRLCITGGGKCVPAFCLLLSRDLEFTADLQAAPRGGRILAQGSLPISEPRQRLHASRSERYFDSRVVYGIQVQRQGAVQ